MKDSNPVFPFVGAKPLGFAVLALLMAVEASGGQRSPARGGPAPGLTPRLAEVFNEGVEAMNTGQWDSAEKAFLKVLNEGGKEAFVYNNLGIVYQQQGKREQALREFRESIRLEPDYPAPHVLMGSTLLVMGRFEEATRELETAVKLQPQDPLIRAQLALAYRGRQDLPGVVEQYQVVRELAPRDPEYVYQSAKAYLDLSAWCFQQIVHLQPDSARAYQALGENFRAEGRGEIAVHAFERAAQADPTLPEIHLALAEIYAEQGKTAEAQKEVEQELAIVPESAAALALKKKLNPHQDSTPP
ncbi:MAG: tetratricopeptide repeat protein [Acidobacteriia bacterium]|nr:tetratricopeptide repeat protein [Terriglobia bacterium]